MKMMRQFLRPTLAIALLLGAASGCGKKADSKIENSHKEETVLQAATRSVAASGASSSKPVQMPADEAKELVNTMRPEAERGDAEAQYYMGVFYVNGAGVPTDHVEALKWFQLAAAQDNKEAITARDMVTKLLTSEQRAEVEKRVKAFTPAKSGDKARP